ncbi:MAG TPA: hypothetical protein PKD26_04940 [Pyrinomonadaceae bacterium]|nr:hypothetical protein [Pyrinomonadaceae bacterium]
MPKKFDTNPLDPEFPEKARATGAGEPFTAPSKTAYSTSEFPSAPGSVTEDETRRFDEAQFAAYGFQGGPSPALYQPTALSEMNRAGDRKVSKTGLPEKWLIGLPYFPFSIGLVAGLILLLIIPKDEAKVRFHAAQGLAAHVGILIITTLLGIVGNVTDLAGLGSGIFTLVTTIMLVIFAIKAWRGKPVHIESVDDLTNWLEEKIGPVKS